MLRRDDKGNYFSDTPLINCLFRHAVTRVKPNYVANIQNALGLFRSCRYRDSVFYCRSDGFFEKHVLPRLPGHQLQVGDAGPTLCKSTRHQFQDQPTFHDSHGRAFLRQISYPFLPSGPVFAYIAPLTRYWVFLRWSLREFRRTIPVQLHLFLADPTGFSFHYCLGINSLIVTELRVVELQQNHIHCRFP